MLPVAFLSRVTEITYEQPEKRSIGISWSKTKVEERGTNEYGFDAAFPFTRDKTRQWERP